MTTTKKKQIDWKNNEIEQFRICHIDLWDKFQINYKLWSLFMVSITLLFSIILFISIFFLFFFLVYALHSILRIIHIKYNVFWTHYLYMSMFIYTKHTNIFIVYRLPFFFIIFLLGFCLHHAKRLNM